MSLGSPSPSQERHSQTVPVLAEELQLARERVETGAVRVRIETNEITQPVELQSSREWVEVARVPVGTTVPQRLPPWQDGDMLVVPVYEERLVVRRELVLTEELRLRRRRDEQTERVDVPLLREHAKVERRDADGGWRPADCDASAGVTARSLSGTGETR